MVGQLTNNDNNPEPQIERVVCHHNLNPQVLRDLIKRALSPLPVDPVPSRVIIDDIVITKDETGGLSFSCEVIFEGVC